MITHFQLTCILRNNVMDSTELINNEQICLNRWLKFNKISIKTKYMRFYYHKNVNLPIIKMGNNKINEPSVTKFVGIHLDQKCHFVNYITEISMKVTKSIGL